MISHIDIKSLFEAMRATYGAKWKHGARVVPVWYRALEHSHPDHIRKAANDCLLKHPTYPPTLPEFQQLVFPPSLNRRANTYIEPPKKSWALRQANKVMLRVVIESKGLDDFTLNSMTDLKNALVEDYGENDPTGKWCADLRDQFIGLIPTRSTGDDAAT